jgi:hypothetical protein
MLNNFHKYVGEKVVYIAWKDKVARTKKDGVIVGAYDPLWDGKHGKPRFVLIENDKTGKHDLVWNSDEYIAIKK